MMYTIQGLIQHHPKKSISHLRTLNGIRLLQSGCNVKRYTNVLRIDGHDFSKVE